MTPTLYPHEWVLKHFDIDSFIEAIILLTFGLGVAIVIADIADGGFVNVLVLGFLMIVFSMIIYFIGKDRSYGRKI
jgi:multisubunit Na+/H+ antiporter MnhB subunit